jgi:predicted DNA binding CopG/RHH family protein
MPKKQAKIPKFKSLKEEQDFWDTHSILDFPDQFERVEMDFSELKPSTKPITIRLPVSLIYELKVMANKRDVPYQSFIKTILHDKVREEYAN